MKETAGRVYSKMSFKSNSLNFTVEENRFIQKIYEACFTLDAYLHGQDSAFIPELHQISLLYFLYFGDSLKQISLSISSAVHWSKNTKTHDQSIVLYTRFYSNVIHYANL